MRDALVTMAKQSSELSERVGPGGLPLPWKALLLLVILLVIAVALSPPSSLLLHSLPSSLLLTLKNAVHSVGFDSFAGAIFLPDSEGEPSPKVGCSDSVAKRKSGGVQRRKRGAVSYFAEYLDSDPWGVEPSGPDGAEQRDIAAVRSSLPVSDPKSADTEAEALATLNAAVEFRQAGKERKARRLFQHALALAPTHPDVLNEYGLFMETHSDDVLQAERLYTRALLHNPQHEDARKNRERTAPLVEEIDNAMLGVIDGKRETFLALPRHSPALRRAMKEAYFLHVYHTVAIEGNTMSLLQTRSILETRLTVGGKSVLEHNEILGMDAALRYLNSSLVHRIGEITIQDIQEIHRRVLGFVDPIQAGIFRETQVYVGDFVPVPPARIADEMDDFIQWLNSEEALEIHPVELAALAHYKFVYIHPFIDGNGRTSRLLANLILMQAGFPPIIIRVEDRLQYYETLQAANEGDLRPFIRFVAAATDRTLDSYLAATSAHGHRQAWEALPKSEWPLSGNLAKGKYVNLQPSSAPQRAPNDLFDL